MLSRLMSPTYRRGARRPSRTGDMARDETGAAAIEFALVALPFFYLLMAILEVAVVFTAELNLGSGIDEAVRQIRTGSFTGTKDDFVTEICSRAIVVPDCQASVKVDVKEVSTYAEATGVDASEMCQDGADPDAFDVGTGGGESIMLARICYEWELFTPFMSRVFAFPAGSDVRTILSTVAWSNEPF